MNRKKSIAWFVGMFLAISCFSQGVPVNPFKVSMNKDKTVLPLSYRSGTNPLVRVKINGKGPYNFMFDTGSPSLLKLDQRIFDMWKLPVVDSVRAGDGSGINTVTFPITSIDKLEMGDLVIANSHAMVRNYNTRPGIDSIDGVIGMEFFDGLLVEFNFEKNELIITKGSLKKNDPNVYEGRYRNGVPGMKLKFADKETDADFDTGNMGWLTLHSNMVTADMMIGEPRVVGRGRTVSNTFEIKEVQLKDPIKIGQLLFESPTVVLNETLRNTNAGIRFLKQMNITLDKSNSLVKLVKFTSSAAAPSAPTPAAANTNEYTGRYGDRTISLGKDGFLYLERAATTPGGPKGMLLKMIEKKKDEYTIEIAPGSAIIFLRNEQGKIYAMKVGRGDGNWETVQKG